MQRVNVLTEPSAQEEQAGWDLTPAPSGWRAQQAEFLFFSLSLKVCTNACTKIFLKYKYIFWVVGRTWGNQVIIIRKSRLSGFQQIQQKWKLFSLHGLYNTSPSTSVCFRVAISLALLTHSQCQFSSAESSLFGHGFVKNNRTQFCSYTRRLATKCWVMWFKTSTLAFIHSFAP